MFQVILPSHEPHIVPTIMMLANALQECGVHPRLSPLRHKPLRALAKFLSIIGIRRLPFKLSAKPVFIQLNHPWNNAFYPYIFLHPLVTYSFDIWPNTQDDWEKVFIDNQPSIAFLSSKHAVETMQRRLPFQKFQWLPEAADPNVFSPSTPLVDRSNDLLQVGRTYKAIDEALSDLVPLNSIKYRHLYSTDDHQVSYTEVVEAYASSKMTICFPKTVTHPHFASGLETVTLRYFECILSKTLIVGKCPTELQEILGFNPVIEINHPHQIDRLLVSLLPEIESYQPLVDRAYQTLKSRWTSQHQAEIIHQALKSLKPN